ncbi:MAG: branched-chain amino acid ABC transporter permease [Janthinobacterium lividum]
MFGSVPPRQLAGPVLLAIAGALLPQLLNGYVLFVINALMVTAVLALGLDLLVGRAGQFAFSHMAFYGIGSYGTAYCLLHWGLPTPVGAVIAAGLSALVSLVIALPAARLRAIYLALATFGFAQAAFWGFQNALPLTGGPDGQRLQSADLFGYRIIDDARAMPVLAATLALVLLASLYLYRSRLGRALVAIRDSEHVAAVSGIDVRRTKVIAFVLSSTYASIAGSMLTVQTSFINPETFNSGAVILVLAMLVVGGSGSIAGTLVGVVTIGLLPDLLRNAPAGLLIWQEVIYGAILLLSIMFMPHGIRGAVLAGFRRSGFRRAGVRRARA